MLHNHSNSDNNSNDSCYLYLLTKSTLIKVFNTYVNYIISLIFVNLGANLRRSKDKRNDYMKRP